MIRRAFDGFSAVVPDGWRAALDEATYSDPLGATPTRFIPPAPGGELLVSVPLLDADEQPGADPDELEGLAREWGLRRGIDEPVAVATETRSLWGETPHAPRPGRQAIARASASYRIGDDLVEVGFLSDGTAMLSVTYVCPWSDRERHRAAREALIGSLRFS